MILETSHPIALTSPDHMHPRGAKNDNTHCPAFVKACEWIYPLASLLDLGCAGGGLVKDFIDVGFDACGLEGSDYPRANGLGEWKTIPKNLFCCDITKPFKIKTMGNGIKKFDVITAWEVLEHIPESNLATLFTNIRTHLKKDGLFVASVATYPDVTDGVTYHVTLQDRAWWVSRLLRSDLSPIELPFALHELPRGSGNPLATGDWKGEQYGFHIAARKI